MKTLRTLGIIPARGGSKRLPRKNLRQFGGKPLVAWSIEAAQASRRLDRIVVSSDHAEILAIAAKYNDRMAVRRPDEYSTEVSPAIDYVRHALQLLESQGEGPFDAVVILQPSSPFTRSEDIDATVDLLADSGADTAVSVMQVDHAIHPAKLKIMQSDRLLAYLEEENGRMAASELPPVFVRNCSVYATRRAVVDAGQIIGADCRGYVMPRERSLDINEELDLAFAEFLLARNPTGSPLPQ